jgi:hypothetical protein
VLRLGRHGLGERRDLLCRISIKVFLDQLGELGIDRAHFCGSVEMRLRETGLDGEGEGVQCCGEEGNCSRLRGMQLGLGKDLLDWAGVHTGRSAAAETMAAVVAAAAEAAAAEVVAAGVVVAVEVEVVEPAAAAAAVVVVVAAAELD